MRHISVVAGGTAVAQGINIVIMPILSRIYSPNDFGVMAAFVSITSILLEVSGFRYHFAIPLPKHERYGEALVVLSFLLQAVFVAFVVFLVLVFGKPILLRFSMEVLMPYRVLIPVGIAGMGAYLTLTYWAIREQKFNVIGRTRITQALSGAFAKIGFGLWGFMPLGLLLGSIISQAGGITTLLLALLKEKGLPKPVGSDLKRVAIRYRKFPMYSTWNGVLNAVGRQIMPILLVSIYTPHVAGLFSMAQNLLHLPSAFIGQAIGQVFLQRASVARYHGNLKALSMRTYTVLLQLSLFPIFLVSFFAPPVFAFFLGERWLEAGAFARVLAPWIALSFVTSPMSSIFPILDRQGAVLVFEIFYMTARVFAFYFGSKFGGPLFATALFGAVGFVALIFFAHYVLILTGNSFRHIFWINIYAFLEAGTLLLLPAMSLFFKMHFIIVAAALFLSVALYLISSIRAFRSLKTAGGEI
ncbi:MAG TPA: oligosaccharide flippase family protein [Tepidanaerobacter syntrophicus]|uniref:oligosaccharide flippase family protein n=1 Tax=Tepidanaerobacter syntrophicus TaxID=224999 RepID=UPI00174FCDCE|nr:oligosaccharide flippase family protein [Tepidanaerobacter syntrophicus]HHV83783.1 oligosaccharide flippase family protein [Tepidanaerobacter syntrophicus]